MNRDDSHTPLGTVTIRRLGEDDREAVERLAELDSTEPLDGDALGAEVEGSLLAAISLSSGEVLADPFSRTGELRAMLELRAKQLRRRIAFERSGWRIGPRRGRAALAASPPGAGGAC